MNGILSSTMEVRWFLRGPIPREILAWFEKHGEQPAQPATRIDHYLRLSHIDSLGVKLREGNIEVKQRQRQLGTVRFHEHVRGMVEHWRKWSFALAATSLRDLLLPPSAWLPVYKARRLHRYQVGDDGTLSSISPKVYPEQGCDLEVTQVRLHNQAWWTIGFEAFGGEDALRGNLCLVAEQILEATPPPALPTHDSYAYPRWLQIADPLPEPR
jgi:hypothetical protein